MTLDEGHYLLFVVITYGKVSLWFWKSLKNSEFFSPTLWPPCNENYSLTCSLKIDRASGISSVVECYFNTA